MKASDEPRRILVAVTAICLAACMPKPDREAQKQRAMTAKKQLFDTLSQRLKTAIDSGGAAAAISVCAGEAPALTERAAIENGVKMGRTSVRLRNTGNTAPEWAVPLLAKDPDEPTFASLPGGKLGALLPIRLKKMCEQCHGDPATIAKPVREALASLYPDDRATGYREGDLRGWFWLEIPRR